MKLRSAFAGLLAVALVAAFILLATGIVSLPS